jgi:hypothetical protein
MEGVMNKQPISVRVAVTAKFVDHLKRALAPKLPVAPVPTRPEDSELMARNGHDVFCARVKAAHSAQKESK